MSQRNLISAAMARIVIQIATVLKQRKQKILREKQKYVCPFRGHLVALCISDEFFDFLIMIKIVFCLFVYFMRHIYLTWFDQDKEFGDPYRIIRRQSSETFVPSRSLCQLLSIRIRHNV